MGSFMGEIWLRIYKLVQVYRSNVVSFSSLNHNLVVFQNFIHIVMTILLLAQSLILDFPLSSFFMHDSFYVSSSKLTTHQDLTKGKARLKSVKSFCIFLVYQKEKG